MVQAASPCGRPTIGELAELLGAYLAGRAGEALVVAHLDADARLVGLTDVAGAADTIVLPVRRIIAEALACDAAALLVAHNHPSGDPTPSADDREATARLAIVAQAVDLRLIDHLVFAAGRWRSFRALGLL